LTIGSNHFDDERKGPSNHYDEINDYILTIEYEERGLGTVFFLEFLFTFLLCYVVWQVAVNPKNKGGTSAPLAIGFAVFLAHLVLIPIDGCSINPSRSFGPAMISNIMKCDDLPEELEYFELSTRLQVGRGWRGKDIAAYVVFPMLGGAAAAGLYKGLLKLTPTSDEATAPDPPQGA